MESKEEGEHISNVLKPIHCWGLDRIANDDCIHMMDDSHILYVAGRQIILQSLVNQDQTMLCDINNSENVLEISTIAISPCRRFLAAAQVTTTGLRVLIINLSKRIVVRVIDNLSSDHSKVSSISFSGDSQVIALLFPGSRTHLSLITWKSKRVVAATQCAQNVSRVAFSPDDASIVYMYKPDLLVYKLLVDGLRPLSLSNVHFREVDDLLVLPDEEVIISAEEELYFAKQLEIVGSMPLPTIPHCLFASKSGGGSNNYVFGMLIQKKAVLFHRNETKFTEIIHKIGRSHGLGGKMAFLGDKGWCFSTIPHPEVEMDLGTPSVTHEFDKKFVSITSSPGDDSFILLSEIGDMHMFKPLASRNEDELRKTELIIPSFTDENIIDFDVCHTRPFMCMVCGKELRVFNYFTKKMIINKVFFEKPVAVAIHPNSYQLLVVFKLKVCVFIVQRNNIEETFSYTVKNASAIQFSKNGAVLAIAQSNKLYLYDYTAFNDAPITVFEQETTIIDICFSICGSFINIRDSHGSCLVYDIRDEVAIAELGHPSNPISAFASGRSVISVSDYMIQLHNHVVGDGRGSDPLVMINTAVIIEDSVVIAQLLAPKSLSYLYNSYRDMVVTDTRSHTHTHAIDRNVSPTTLAMLDEHVLVAGDNGLINVYDYDGALQFKSDDWVDRSSFSLHLKPIKKMQCVFSNRLLFTQCNNTIYMSYVGDLPDNIDPLNYLAGQPQASGWSLLLVQSKELDDVASEMDTLQRKLETQEVKFSFEVKEIEKNFKDKLQQEKDMFETVLNEKDTVLQTKNGKLEEIEMNFTEQIKHKEIEHMSTITNLESENRKRIQQIKKIITALETEKAELVENYEEELNNVKLSHGSEVKNLEKQYMLELESKTNDIVSLENQNKILCEGYEEEIVQVNDDFETFSNRIEKKFLQELSKKKQSLNQLTLENLNLKRKFKTYQEQIVAKSVDLKKAGEQIQVLEKNILDHEKKIQLLKLELEERNETISEKERQIFVLKTKNAELEKFKYVLCIKISDLKNQIEPRDLRIQKYKKQIQTLDGFLEKNHQQQVNLKFTLHERDINVRNLKQQITDLQNHLQQKTRIVQYFIKDLGNLVENVSPKYWRDCLQAMYRTYCTTTDDNEIIQRRQTSSEVSELQRQREHLEQRVKGLERSTEVHRNFLGAQRKQFLGHNKKLMEDINELRFNNHRLEQELGRSKNEVRTLKAKLNDVRGTKSSMSRQSRLSNRAPSTNSMRPLSGSRSSQLGLLQSAKKRPKGGKPSGKLLLGSAKSHSHNIMMKRAETELPELSNTRAKTPKSSQGYSHRLGSPEPTDVPMYTEETDPFSGHENQIPMM
ncbi:hypothetical protein PCE1_002342 [Barthelona sp. PCE]